MFSFFVYLILSRSPTADTIENGLLSPKTLFGVSTTTLTINLKLFILGEKSASNYTDL